MASVRLTEKFKSMIETKARQLFSERIGKAEKKLRPDFFDDVMQGIKEDYFDKYMQRNCTDISCEANPLPAFPEDWFKNFEYIAITLENQSYSVTKLNKTYKIITLYKHTAGSTFQAEENQVRPELIQEHLEYITRVRKLIDERNEFIKSLNVVLKNCNTLTQFLKVWPQGEHLVSGLEFETTTQQRKKKTIDIDEETLKALNGGLLKQTMLNS